MDIVLSNNRYDEELSVMTLRSDGNVSIAGTLTVNGDNLQFPGTLNQYKINLWGTNSYGFGIASGTLMYSSQSFHKFYNSSNNANTFTIDSAGNISSAGAICCSGDLTVGGTVAPNLKFGNIGGLRIAGWDYGNTLYQSIVIYDIGMVT